MAQHMIKTMFITGGSRGIGKATALAAARAGWQVAFTYRSNRDEAAATVAAVEALGQPALALCADTASEAAMQAAFDVAEGRFGALDAVIVNAGIVAPSLPLAEMSADRLRQMVDINLFGALLTAREAARRLQPRAEGNSASLVFVSSAAARLGSAFEYVDYAATKGAIDTLTLGLSRELAPSIRVNAVRPGLIETEIHASGSQPDRAQRLGCNVPMGRPGTADEVAQAILWLCSAGASYTTGALLDVAGGR